MKKPILKGFDPFIHLIVLLLISFVSVALFLMLGNKLVELIWGIDVFTNINVLSDFSIPEVVHANKLLLFFQHLGMFVLPPLVFAQLVSFSATDYLYLQKPFRSSHWVLAIAAMILALLPINLLVEWNAGLTLPESLGWLEDIMQSAEQQAAELTEALLANNSGITLWVNILVIAAVPAIGEELMFRSGIQRIVSQWSGNAHVGIWVSAVLFSAIHFQFYGFVPRLALGALFGYMLIWSGSVWMPIAAHFFNNATAVILHHFIQTGAVPAEADTVGTGSDGMVFSIVSAILLGVLLWFWRKQSSWPAIRPQYEAK